MANIFIFLFSALLFLNINAPVAHANGYIFPVSGNFRVTQEPGNLFSHSAFAKPYPCAECAEAWDLAGSGVPVVVADGTVISAGWQNQYDKKQGYGLYVKIRHPDGLISLYAHLADGSLLVKKGDEVVQKQQIGVIDSTGVSTGQHLHFSLFKNDNPYSTNGLIDFSNHGGNIVEGVSDFFSPKVGGGGPPEPLKPIDLKPIGDMVTNLYNWALDIGAAIALGIVIWGGVLYISSAGDPGKQNEAKKWVKAAIFGLIILFTGYLILYTINPCLVGAGSGCV